jgi:hypothetical protein
MRRGEKGRAEDLLLLNLIENLMLSKIEKKTTVENELELRSPESARMIEDLSRSQPTPQCPARPENSERP